jgi:hypothetical protein
MQLFYQMSSGGLTHFEPTLFFSSQSVEITYIHYIHIYLSFFTTFWWNICSPCTLSLNLSELHRLSLLLVFLAYQVDPLHLQR